MILDCLAFLDLSDYALYFRDFFKANLEGAYLERAHLERAYLIGAHLEGTYLIGAHLEGAYKAKGFLRRILGS